MKNINVSDKTIDSVGYTTKKTKQNSNNIFREEFNKAIINYNNVQILDKEISNKYKDNSQIRIENIVKMSEEHKEIISNTIKDMQEIFGIDMSQEQYYKKNNKININDIIDKYGNNVSSNDLNRLERTITSLWKEGMIDDDDYFKAIKWISLKVEQKNIKIKLEHEKKKVEDIIYSHHKNLYLYNDRNNK